MSRSPQALEALLRSASAEERDLRIAVLRALGNSDDQRAVAVTAQAAQARTGGASGRRRALRTQSGILYAKKKFKEGQKLAQLALQARERALGPGQVELAVDLNNLAVFFPAPG